VFQRGNSIVADGGRSLDEVAGLNLTDDLGICLFGALCMVM